MDWMRVAGVMSLLPLLSCGRPPEALPEPDGGSRVDAGASTDAGTGHDAGSLDAGELTLTPTPTEAVCLASGWRLTGREVGGHPRRVLSLQPAGPWTKGAVLVLHGGGGQADQFCTGGTLVQPQVAFAREAVRRGFAVFALDSTTNVVVDEQGRPCGKRFDFSVLPRANVDLPFIEWVAKALVPQLRPAGSRPEVFITGLSTGGAMTTRAATHFDDVFTAFAPVSAVDPYGTDAICDSSLSPRDSAVGILVDRETRREIIEDDACASMAYPNESPWSTTRTAVKPTVRQFHDEKDGIVDLSCMRKLSAQLQTNGYPFQAPFLLQTPGTKNALLHLWRASYNAPLLDFFAGFTP